MELLMYSYTHLRVMTYVTVACGRENNTLPFTLKVFIRQ